MTATECLRTKSSKHAVSCTSEERGVVLECDGETIRKAQRGDAAAWEALVRRHIGWIYGACRRWTGSVSNAEDLTQDVFLKIFQNLHSYRGELGGFRTWARRIVRNLLIDDYRRNRKERCTVSYDSADERMKGMLGSVPAQEFHPDGNIRRMETEAALRQAFRQLGPQQREAVILRDVQGLSYVEISEILQAPVGTVKSRVNRGRIELVPLMRRQPAFRSRLNPSASAVA